MKMQLIRITTLSLFASSILCASGYKIPETSLNAVALSAANVAHNTNADAAYYNAANMAFMKDENSLELDMMIIGLDATNFKGSGSQAGDDINAKSETFVVPSLHYVSSKLGDARLGLSIVAPGGLTKRWTDSPAKDKAEEFTLKIIEINPTVAYPINDKLAVAIGARMLYSEGIVKSTSVASRDMIGESLDFGYNLALAYKATKELELGLTYRSKINLTEEGNAKLFIGDGKVYDGGSSVTVPLPACLSAALAYTFASQTTVEFVYERSFWSAYSSLDFDYSSTIPAILQPSFDAAISKDWKDSDAFRVGVTQELDNMTIMAGAVYGQTPVPEEKLSYELPDSNSLSLSVGARYEINQEWSTGVGVLYSMRENRKVSNDDIEGEFSNSNVLLVSAGVGYKF
jgi:long-chain fatty acid transport protein